MTEGTKAPVSVVVLTMNEERNIDACLRSVTGWTDAVFVVDSGSTDRTVAIAREQGASVAVHAFESHARQWRWALDTLDISSPWILALDADQQVSPALRDELIHALTGPAADASIAGYYLCRRQIFRGRWIRFGGYYPKYLLKLFRRSRGSVDPSERVDHHFSVDGPVGILRGDLIEDNQNELDIASWIAKHNRYARLQAAEELELLAAGATRGRFWGHADERTAWLKSIWWRLPLYVRPFLYFKYRYVLRLGFLDGKQGFIFHFMQGLWYRLLVDINRDELSAQTAGRREG